MRNLAFATTFFFAAGAFAADAPEANKSDVTSWRAQRPKVPAPPTPVLPTFTKTTLANGLTLLVTEIDTVPVVSFNLVSKGGATFDPAGKVGLSATTYSLLEEGAGDLEALAFSDAVADLGASFGASASRQSGGVSISGLAKHADAMLGLLADAAIRPRLDAKAFARVKAESLATLQRKRGSPQGLAFERIPTLIYGEGHPYGHPPTGTVETVSGLTLEDVKAHYAKTMGPAHSALVVAGALDLETAKKLADKHFGAWKTAAEAPPAVPYVEANKRTKVVLVDKPGAAQTMMVIGRPIFAKGHPDEHALMLGNLVFGGSFSARLNMNLREAKGYTYGAYSQTAFRNGVGVFIAYSALRTDVTGAGLKETLGELAGLVAKPATKMELDAFRTGHIRSLPGNFEVSSAIASAAGALFVEDLPLDYFAKRAGVLEAVTLDAVRGKSIEYLNPDLMQILLVGDAAKVKPQIEALGLGTITVESEGHHE